LFSVGACDLLEPRELNHTRGHGGREQLDGGLPMRDASPEPRFATVVVEAENYDVLDDQGKARDYFRLGAGQTDDDLPNADPDPSHEDTASGGSYLEVLPDRRVTPDDTDSGGLFNEPGKGPLVHYYVALPVAGTYYLWIRGFSTGSEDETAFFTIDTDWDSAKLVSLCSDVDEWQWASHEREGRPSCGMIGEVRFEISSAGVHTRKRVGTRRRIRARQVATDHRSELRTARPWPGGDSAATTSCVPDV